jgi:hypothetical protein
MYRVHNASMLVILLGGPAHFVDTGLPSWGLLGRILR